MTTTIKKTFSKPIKTESGARKALKKLGYSLQKSTRISKINMYHNGCYRIVDSRTNFIEAGENYDLTFDDVINFIKGWSTISSKE